jgi:hypothetical protein
MNTVESILLTQIPISIAILVLAYQAYLLKKELVAILKTLSELKNKKKLIISFVNKHNAVIWINIGIY